ncbi:MAG: ABC transporter permease DevC [Cyanobacteria bacterium P01_D01_bin.115]
MFRREIPLAWLQLIRRKGRFLTAIAGIAFANILILMQLGFQNALYDSNTRLHNRLNADYVMLNPTAQNLSNLNTFPRRRLFQVENFPQVASTTPLYVSIAFWKNPQTRRDTSIIVLGFDPLRPAFDLPELPLQANTMLFPDTLLFDRESRGNYAEAIAQIAEGEWVTTEILGRQLVLGGLYAVGASFVADGSVMTNEQTFLRIFSGRQAGEVSVGLIQLRPGSDVDAVANLIRQNLPDDIKVLTRQEFIDFEADYWRSSTSIGFIFSLGVVMGFVVGVIIVYQILYSDVSDHLPEYATLKAMGYHSGYLLSVVSQEALILAIAGYIPGYLVSSFLYDLTRDATNLPLVMTYRLSFFTLALTVLMCAISGVVAMRKLRAADPADIF